MKKVAMILVVLIHIVGMSALKMKRGRFLKIRRGGWKMKGLDWNKDKGRQNLKILNLKTVRKLG